MSNELIGFDCLGNEVRENRILFLNDDPDDRWYCIVEAYSGDFYIASIEERPGVDDPRYRMDIVINPISELGKYQAAFTADGEPLYGKTGEITERHMELFLSL